MRKNKRTMSRILFLDTETAGIPENLDTHITNIDNWPRIVQMAWIICDNSREIVISKNYFTQKNSFRSKRNALDNQGANSEYVKETIQPINIILADFCKDLSSVNLIVGHNIEYDIKILGSELHRVGYENYLSIISSICTMNASINYCLFETDKGLRFPKLQELHTKLFSIPFVNAHDAYSDTLATYKCFWKLIDLGYIDKESHSGILMPDKEIKEKIKEYCKLGWEYAVGIRGSRSEAISKSFENYLKAAELGDPFAQFQAGLRYYNTKSSSSVNNQDEAKYWFKLSANNGYSDADSYLGLIFEKEKKYQLAQLHYDKWEKDAIKKAKSGDNQALIEIAMSYKYGRKGKKIDIVKAKSILTKVADSGDIRSMGELCSIFKEEGNYIMYLDYCIKRLEAAKKLNTSYSKSTYNNSLVSENRNFLAGCFENVGYAYFEGLGTEVDTKKAIYYLSESLKLNESNDKILYFFGGIYEKGLYSTEINYNKAFEFYSRVNKHANLNVLQKLGEFHYYGLGVPKDYEKALRYFKEAKQCGVDTNMLLENTIIHKYKSIIIAIIVIIVISFVLLVSNL